MKTQTSFRLSRRQFLTTASALAAGGALSTLPFGLRPAAAATVVDGEYLQSCQWGAFWAKVEEGRFTSLRPWEGDPHPTPQLEGFQDIVYSSSRIRYPMVRRDWLENGPGSAPETRGTGDFVRVSWEEALELVAGEISRVQEQEGPWAIYTGTYGWRSNGRANNPQTMLKRLMNLTGGSVVSSSNYSKAGIEAIMPYVLGQVDAFGPQSTHQTIVENTDLIVFWATDPLKNNQISAAIPDHGEYAWFEDMKKAGKKAVFIDPSKTEGCKILDGEWLQVRPHSDTALALGMAHTLLTEELLDRDFLENCTTGFDIFAEYLMGNEEGVEKTAEWAAEKSDIPADTIRDLARRLTQGRSMLVSGWTPQRQQYGEQFPWAFVTLAAMVGQIGLPGGGFCQRYHLDNPGAPMANGPKLGSPSFAIGDRKELKEWPAEKGTNSIPCARVVDMLLNPGASYDHNGKTFTYPDIKLSYWVGGNPFHHHQDRNRMVEAWKKIETFIVQDYQWTATARHADIVLPATSSAERNDIDRVGVVANKAIIGMKQIIDPVFEARNDFDIFKDLATRLGVEPEFSGGRTDMDFVEEIYTAAREQGASMGVDMPDFETFWNGVPLVEFETPEAALYRTKYADFREDPLLNGLPTPSGLIEIYSNTIEKYGYDDCPPHATWFEPVEWLGQQDTTYPLHVNSNHPQYRMHSQLNGSAKLRDIYNVAGREPCWINPQDAEARGIKSGDVVRIFNGRGQVLAGAVVTEDTRSGVIQLQEGAWYDPADASEAGSVCKYGDPNVLTPDIPTSKLAQGTAGCTCMAELELFQGDAPAVTAFSEPVHG
ncbi:trimethylamine-N-oxide reductase TorA [Aliiruegeria lutimaris]|uniref:trimethylamine-N-oxide reductase n=1 Tax=Aliiruegeria lutimaris TaxID=571298 RepID=A0A1G8S1C0_9RHOB|nr:trimethylamine-N-oxide reductase TorA [Aliiruegeria lutimaris]SDJ23017.1 trimethylamine-N-oxide reductase (cytochrome c) [Aliiruegeria lutimaris]